MTVITVAHKQAIPLTRDDCPLEIEEEQVLKGSMRNSAARSFAATTQVSKRKFLELVGVDSTPPGRFLSGRGFRSSLFTSGGMFTALRVRAAEEVPTAAYSGCLVPKMTNRSAKIGLTTLQFVARCRKEASNWTIW